MTQESETETLYSFPAEEDLLRETQNELQRLQLENIELKSKYKAVKNELQNYQTLNDELESEIGMLARKEKKYQNDLIELKASSQSRIEQLESEIEKYKLDLRTEARNNQLLKIENRRLASRDSQSLVSKEEEYQKDFEKEKKLVIQYNRLVKC